jgi:hypothetical protein
MDAVGSLTRPAMASVVTRAGAAIVPDIMGSGECEQGIAGSEEELESSMERGSAELSPPQPWWLLAQ